MERGTTVFLLLAIAAAAAAAAADSARDGFTGDACKGKGGSAGVCRSISNCPEAREALKRGEHPDICSYEGSTPVVCCPSDRVAARMCTKYGESVFRYEKSPLIPSPVVKIDQCATRGSPAAVPDGYRAKANEFPHMALLGYSEDPQDPQWACGGSLISERFVLTAGHCFLLPLGSPKVVRLGELVLNSTEDGSRHEDFKVAEAVLHPDFKDGVYYNDIGLLRLDRDVVFTASIRPACLHTVPEIGDVAVATGWDFSDWATRDINNHLEKKQQPIHVTEVCSNAYKTLSTTSRLPNGIAGESMVCAGSLLGEKTGHCMGDSGDPLQLQLKTPYCMYSVVGVTSFGKGICGARDSPAVYTRVSSFAPWIEKIVWPDLQ